MGRRSIGCVCRASLVIVVLLVGAAPRNALASSARIRWEPSYDPRVVGYEIYVRAAGSPYGAAVDVGLAAVPLPDGTLSSVIAGLATAHTYHLAVAAYTADGTESTLSGELALGALNPCAVDRCESLSACDLGALPDGTSCTHDAVTDSCTASAVCLAGECTASASGVGRLASTHVRIITRQGKGRFSIHGRFLAGAGFDPAATGATLEIADASGAILYHATVPGDALQQTRGSTAFRYLGRPRAPGAQTGLRILTLFRSGNTVYVGAHGESVDLGSVTSEPALRVTVGFGDACARNLQLDCHVISRSSGISCR